MKKIILSFFCAVGLLGAKAQTTAAISLETGYTNQVYYSLENGVIKSNELASWDIAFDLSAFGYSILTNGGTGTTLYKYSGSVDDYETIDTTGLNAWGISYNSDTSWYNGAFNRITSNDFDLGWGEYSTLTHTTVANALFIIKLASGEYKKIIIESLAAGSYHFKYADIDGGNEESTSISKNDYSSKNFAYYSISDETALDLEPTNDSWDLLFTKYVTSDYKGTPNQSVTGVLVNPSISVSKISKIDVPKVTYNDTLNFPFTETISQIGWDWKTLNYQTFSWELEDSLSYIFKNSDEELFHLYFTSFGGSATGNVEFSISKDAVLGNNNSFLSSAFSVYPNSITQGGTVSITTTSDVTPLLIRVINNKGDEVINTPYTNNLTLDNLSKGLYHISIVSENGVSTHKVIIQ